MAHKCLFVYAVYAVYIIFATVVSADLMTNGVELDYVILRPHIVNNTSVGNQLVDVIVYPVCGSDIELTIRFSRNSHGRNIDSVLTFINNAIVFLVNAPTLIFGYNANNEYMEYSNITNTNNTIHCKALTMYSRYSPNPNIAASTTVKVSQLGSILIVITYNGHTIYKRIDDESITNIAVQDPSNPRFAFDLSTAYKAVLSSQ